MITFNGFSADEILGLADEVLDQSVVSGEAMVFRAGTADVLGRFGQDRTIVLCGSDPENDVAPKN